MSLRWRMIPNLHLPEKHTAEQAKGCFISDVAKVPSCSTSGGHCTVWNTTYRILQDSIQYLIPRAYSQISFLVFQGYVDKASTALGLWEVL